MRQQRAVEDRLPAAPAGATAPGRVSRWTIAGIVALGSVSSLLSSTVVNVAVADLERVFHASLTDVQWVLTAYLLGLSTTIPLSGWATDRFGSKRVYLLTLGLFTLLINALLLYFVGALVKSFVVAGFWPAFWGALVISLVSLVLNSITGTGNSRIELRRTKARSGGRDGDGPVIDV